MLINLFWPGNPRIPAVLPDFTCGFRFGCVTHTITNPNPNTNRNSDSDPDSNTYPHAYDLLLCGFGKRQ